MDSNTGKSSPATVVEPKAASSNVMNSIPENGRSSDGVGPSSDEAEGQIETKGVTSNDSE